MMLSKTDRGKVATSPAIAHGARLWLLVAVLVFSTPQASDFDPAFQAGLELAASLNVTASWQETRAALDEILPRLDQASDEQFAAYELIHIRNLALAGRLEESLAAGYQLLDRPLTPAQNIRAHGMAANIAMIGGRYEASFELLRKGLALEPDVSDTDGLINLFSIAAYIHAQAGETGKAIEYGLRSLYLAEQSQTLRSRCLTLQRLAFAYKRAGDSTQSQRRYLEALSVCGTLADPVILGVVKYGLADMLRMDGEAEEAESLFKRAIALLEQTGYTIGLAEARLFHARLHQQQGSMELAEEALAGIADVFFQQGIWEYQAEALKIQADIIRGRGDMDAAFELLTRSLDARKLHMDRDRAMHLAYLGVQFDVEFKEQELALLREQRRVAGLEQVSQQQRQRLQTLAAVAALLLLLVLALFLLQARHERRRFRDLSRCDGLTGLNNHTRFFEVAGQQLDHSRHARSNLVLIVADIDFFKKINDLHGHQVGDKVLRWVAEQMHETFSDHGTLGRIGGEEFAISLPGHSLDDAQRWLGQFRQRLATHEANPAIPRVSMSFGIATLRNGETLDQLRARADAALYQAKETGRDRVLVSEPGDAGYIAAQPFR